jgi:hypothetical protein
MLIGLDLSTAARPRSPWAFDPESMPLLGAVGAAEAVSLDAPSLQSAHRRLEIALEHTQDKRERAWIQWRLAELSAEDPLVRAQVLAEVLEANPDRELELALRATRGQLLIEGGESAAAARELARVIEREPDGELAMSVRYALAEAGPCCSLVIARSSLGGEMRRSIAIEICWSATRARSTETMLCTVSAPPCNDPVDRRRRASRFSS